MTEAERVRRLERILARITVSIPHRGDCDAYPGRNLERWKRSESERPCNCGANAVMADIDDLTAEAGRR